MQKLQNLSISEQQSLFQRFGSNYFDIMMNTVAPIIQDVQKNGDLAVFSYAKKFDDVNLDALYASEEEIEKGYASLSGEALDAFRSAQSNIEEFHNHQKRQNIEYSRKTEGVFGIKYEPIKSAAIYVPGGKAQYPSSVLMGVIPAKIAGVQNITIITPSQKNGQVHPSVCAVCHMCGITKILKTGGAHGVAAAGLGTETVRKSDIIVGPGNMYVTAAKSYLFSLGVIQIDSLAGPSETLIIADEKADPKWVAYDLLSQAEHEENARAVFVTVSETLAEAVQREIQNNLAAGLGRIAIKKKVVETNLKILIADSIEDAIEFSNNYAPEHMQLMVENPMKYLDQVRCVGSLFLGYYSPVAAGDYFSGTNHGLPTGGAARFSSGLSVDTFYRRTTWQNLTREGLHNAVEPVSIMSAIEGFDDMHGGSVRVRFE